MVEQRLANRDAPYVRYVQVDVLRGFAVLGIYWINVFVFALPETLGHLPSELNDDSQLNSTIGIFSEVYIEGTMRALFSMLFGASALIFLDEARLAASGLDLVDRYYRRTLLLILFGLIHAYLLLWPYDVLYAYGLFGLFLFPLRKLSARTLLICGIVLLILGDLQLNGPRTRSDPITALSEVVMQEQQDLSRAGADEPANSPPSTAAPVENESGLAAPDIDTEQFSDEESVEDIRVIVAMAAYRADYATIFTIQRKMVAEKQSRAIYEEYIFDIGGMMLIGMALWKLGMLSGQRARIVYLILAAVGYVLGAGTRFVIALFGLGSDPGSIFTAYNLGRLLITFGHIGLIGLLCYSGWLKSAVNLLAGVGRMSLTNYLMQTIISIFLFYGFGFALYAELQRYQVALIGIGVGLFQIVYSNLWLIWFKHGPLEWLWRSMIYGKTQSIRLGRAKAVG